MNKVVTNFTAKTRNVFNFLSTYVAKLPFDNCPIRPCVSNGVLNERSCNVETRQGYSLETFLVDYYVADFANVSLAHETP